MSRNIEMSSEGATALSGGRKRTEPRVRPVVLVVEDEPHDWEIYGKLLYYNGFDVKLVLTGEEGLRVAKAEHPDAILLDLVLPDTSGLEVCRRLKADPSTRDIPVFALSARGKSEMERPALAAGCVRYLEKPLRPARVVHEVESLLGRPRPAGEEPPSREETPLD